MPILAVALFAGMTAMAVVPGAEGPVPPRRAAPASAVPSVPRDAAARWVVVEAAPCGQIDDGAPQATLSPADLYQDLAEYGRSLLARFFEALRAWSEQETGLAL